MPDHIYDELGRNGRLFIYVVLGLSVLTMLALAITAMMEGKPVPAVLFGGFSMFILWSLIRMVQIDRNIQRMESERK